MASAQRQSRSDEQRQHIGNGDSRNNAKGKLKVIGKEYPDIDTDDQFETNWKLSKAKEVVLWPRKAPETPHRPLLLAWLPLHSQYECSQCLQ